MIVSAHQLNFLPYSGFWYKVAKSDVFDLRYRAQFQQKPGYVRRVMMRGEWCTLPLIGRPRFEPLNQVRVEGPVAIDRTIKTIQGRYSGAEYYKQRSPELLDKLDSMRSCDYLWHFNLELLLFLRDVLGIDTPFSLGVDTIGSKAEGIVSFLRAYPGVTTFLSGKGALKYMEDTTPFDEAGIKVEWTRHQAVTEDSILSVLFDYADPMDIVMREEETYE